MSGYACKCCGKTEEGCQQQQAPRIFKALEPKTDASTELLKTSSGFHSTFLIKEESSMSVTLRFGLKHYVLQVYNLYFY